MQNKRTSKPRFNIHAEVAGAGTGTGSLIILLAKNLPEVSPYKLWIMTLAPFIAVGLAAFWNWLSARVDSYLRVRNSLPAANYYIRALTRQQLNYNSSDFFTVPVLMYNRRSLAVVQHLRQVPFPLTVASGNYLPTED